MRGAVLPFQVVILSISEDLPFADKCRACISTKLRNFRVLFAFLPISPDAILEFLPVQMLCFHRYAPIAHNATYLSSACRFGANTAKVPSNSNYLWKMIFAPTGLARLSAKCLLFRNNEWCLATTH